MDSEKRLIENNRGKYALLHAGRIVIPHRFPKRRPGTKTQRDAFDTFEQAKAWGIENYGSSAKWRVIKL